ncbi:hypothetical protein ColLi_07152 [Colletotrichum liriopes]|uniref:Uncharacterized protein n=1 Tax=Colletotrichum liriopes TaxID=708192 RepID=A0AA37GNJ0_9PEZI|nr:hypothetical protein ColLi_07152 [Colletotrichum liriopes]
MAGRDRDGGFEQHAAGDGSARNHLFLKRSDEDQTEIQVGGSAMRRLPLILARNTGTAANGSVASDGWALERNVAVVCAVTAGMICRLPTAEGEKAAGLPSGLQMESPRFGSVPDVGRGLWPGRLAEIMSCEGVSTRQNDVRLTQREVKASAPLLNAAALMSAEAYNRALVRRSPNSSPFPYREMTRSHCQLGTRW